MNQEKIALNFKQIIEAIGQNTESDGLKETPDRVAKMYGELLSGYNETTEKLFKVFDCSDYNGLVSVINIRFYSLCEHHLIPFFGQISIGYIPNGKILGLSKFARIVKIFSKRLQTQENLTNQIADCIQNNLNTKGCIVYASARHLCMEMRGIESPDAMTSTVVKKGVFESDLNLCNEFFQINKFNLV